MNNTPLELAPELKNYDNLEAETMSRRIVQDTEKTISRVEQHLLEQAEKDDPATAATLKEVIAQLNAKIEEIEFAYSKCARCGDDINRARYRGHEASYSTSLQAEMTHLKGQLEQRCWDLRGIYIDLQDLVSKLENEDNQENLSEV